MLYKITKRKAHNIANDVFGCGSILTLTGFFKTTFSKAFGSTLSKTVLPAQELAYDQMYFNGTLSIEETFKIRVAKNTELSVCFNEVESFDGSLLETMDLIHSEQLNNPKWEQKYVIYLCGNDMCMQDLYNEIYSQCTETKHNFVAFNFRNVMRSSGTLNSELDLIYDVITQVERLRDEGVRLENICFVGHSLGAAFATLTSYIYLLEGQPIRVFNGRSFSNFADMKYFQEKENGSNELIAMFNKILLSFSNFEIEVAKYYALLPDDYKYYITVEQKMILNGTKEGVPDGVIPTEAALPAGLQKYNYSSQSVFTSHKVMSTNRLFGFGHNDPLSLLQSHENDKKGDEICREFILKTTSKY